MLAGCSIMFAVSKKGPGLGRPLLGGLALGLYERRCGRRSGNSSLVVEVLGRVYLGPGCRERQSWGLYECGQLLCLYTTINAFGGGKNVERSMDMIEAVSETSTSAKPRTWTTARLLLSATLIWKLSKPAKTTMNLYI